MRDDSQVSNLFEIFTWPNQHFTAGGVRTTGSAFLFDLLSDFCRKIVTPAVLSMRERDERLVHLVLCGNENAWNTLYQEAVPWVTCAVKGFDHQNFFPDDEHKDIVDEAFTRCYGQLERYQGRSRFRRWVFGYAKNIMYQRRSAQLTAYRNQYLLECAAESQYRGSDPLYILIHLEQARHLWNAFYMLDKIERRIIFQRVFFQKAPRTLAQELCRTRQQVLDLYEGACVKLKWNFLHQS